MSPAWSQRFRLAAPALAASAYWLILARLGGLRSDHWVVGCVWLLLWYGGRLTAELRRFVLPFLLTAVVYDSQRFYSDFLRGPIHVTQPYFFDRRFFGITSAGGQVLTPNEWFQLHTLPVLDLITGFAYLVFLAAFAGVAAYFYFWVGRRGTDLLSPEQARAKAYTMIWCFFWLNVLGYTTYYWYAASPPWYVARYGLGPAIAHVAANPAGCVRFDQILGTHFFDSMYGRAADVHGAIPSLHVSYPFLAFLFALQFKRLRVFSAAFYLVMSFSAVYLNHHYVLDVLWGTGYAALVAFVAGHLVRYRREQPANHPTDGDPWTQEPSAA